MAVRPNHWACGRSTLPSDWITLGRCMSEETKLSVSACLSMYCRSTSVTSVRKKRRYDRVIGWVSSARPLGTVKPLKVYVSLPPSAPRWLITLRVLCSGLGGWTRTTLLGHSRRSDSSHKLITFFHGLRSEFELYIKNLTEVNHMPSKNYHTGDAQSWEKCKVCLNLILNLVNLISLFFYFKMFFFVRGINCSEIWSFSVLFFLLF